MHRFFTPPRSELFRAMGVVVWGDWPEGGGAIEGNVRPRRKHCDPKVSPLVCTRHIPSNPGKCSHLSSLEGSRATMLASVWRFRAASWLCGRVRVPARSNRMLGSTAELHAARSETVQLHDDSIGGFICDPKSSDRLVRMHVGLSRLLLAPVKFWLGRIKGPDLFLILEH